MLIVPTPGIVADETLGRFFSTPAERDHLDRLRHPPLVQPLGPVPERDADVAPSPPEPRPMVEQTRLPEPPPETPVSLEGYVKRSDGQTSLWVNGRVLPDAKAEVAGAEVEIIAPDGTHLHLKPGQVHELTSGRTLDVLAPPDASRPKASEAQTTDAQ